MLDATKTRIDEIKKDATKTDINFNNEALGDEGAKLLVEALGDRKLTGLHLSDSKISVDGIKLFETLIKNSPNLTQLSFNINPFPLEMLSSLTTLESLSLTGCGINDDRMVVLKDIIKNNPKLLTINLTNNSLLEAGLKFLVEGLQNRIGKLTLMLNGNGISLGELKPLIPQIQIDAGSMVQISGVNYQKDTLESAIQFFDIRKRIEEQDQQIQDMAVEIKMLNAQISQIPSMVKTGQQFLDEMLFSAAKTGNSKLVETALSMGANIKAINTEGMTALHISTLADHPETSDLLLSKEPQLFLTPDNSGSTPIQKIAANGHLPRLGKLYAQGKKIPAFVDSSDEFNKIFDVATPEAVIFLANHKLWESAKTNNLQGAKDAISKGANVDEKEEMTQETALHKAVYAKNAEIVDYLIRQHANLEIKNKHDQTAFEMAHKDPKIISVFANHQLLNATLAAPDEDQKVTTSKVLSALDRGAEINGIRDAKNATVLHLAAAQGNVNLVDLLLTKEADIQVKDALGQTPLHKASLNGNKKTIKSLLKEHAKNKIDIKFKDNAGKTAFDITFENDKELAMFILEKFGAYKKVYKLGQDNYDSYQSMNIFADVSTTRSVSTLNSDDQRNNPTYNSPSSP